MNRIPRRKGALVRGLVPAVARTRTTTNVVERWLQDAGLGREMNLMSDQTITTILELSVFDLDMVRQWFNAAQDAAPRYLEQRDYDLAARVHQALGLRIPLSVARHLEGAESHE